MFNLFSSAKSVSSSSRLTDQRPPSSISHDVALSIVTQFYPPDFAATGQFVDELAQHLSDQNVEVQVFTGQPGYAFDTATAPVVEQMGKVRVQRAASLQLGTRQVTSRIIRGLIFCAQTALHLLRRNHRGDILLLTSEPPFLQIIGYLIHKLFGTPYACLVYDLYPEVAVELNVISQNHWITRFWDAVNLRVWRRAATIIVPCQTMKNRIVAKVPEVTNKITVIHNWADPDWIKPLVKAENPFAQSHQLVEPFTVLYSGNMGRCHDMDTILAAALELRHDPVQFLFVGGGPKREDCVQLVEALQLTNCRFLPYQDKSLLPLSLTACDLSLVSVDVGMEGLVAPSKFYSALAAGRPVAVICERHSYLRSLVADANCGAAFSNGDSKGLAGFIRYLAKDPDMTERLGKAGYRYVRDYFTPQQISRQYGKILRRAVLNNADLHQAVGALTESVGEQEFQVYYQPILSLGSNKIVGLEATVRWHHPLRGLICPAEFLSAAEETGLIIPMGWWLLQSVCSQVKAWRSQFPNLALRITLNLSSQQFFQPDLIEQLDRMLESYGLDGRWLMLDIQDRTIMEDAAATTALLLQLQARQIQVCIDDFGASYSSLEYVHRFPVDALKVDRSLISRLEMDTEVVKLIETFVILARDLGMQAIAEGIETEAQLRRLKEIGFEWGQGYLFSSPVAAAAIESWLLDQQHPTLKNPMNISMESLDTQEQSDAPQVLVIDDDRSMRALLKHLVLKEGFRVVEAVNAQQGIELYRTIHPQLVLLDAMMPEMDGFTCCTQLQRLNAEASINASLTGVDLVSLLTRSSPPVLMITALDDGESVDKAFAAGATDYITKPLNWAVLRQKIRQLLKQG